MKRTIVFVLALLLVLPQVSRAAPADPPFEYEAVQLCVNKPTRVHLLYTGLANWKLYAGTVVTVVEQWENLYLVEAEVVIVKI